MNDWLIKNLVCPRDKQDLEFNENNLICPKGHSYPVVNEIPVMLVDEAEITHGYIESTLEKVSKIQSNLTNFTKNISNINGKVDEFVQGEIVHTCGNLYFPVLNKLKRYPIPEFRLPEGKGERLLDVGCNWGRWSIGAAKKGYKPVGIDPSIDAVLAATRVAKQLNVEADFIVGDARFLPFKSDIFDVGFSYGVFQHFSKNNAKISLDEISRVVKNENKIFVQMPNKYGIRSFYQRWKRGFTEGEGFEVRYWTPRELIKTFEEKFGDTKLTVDCYFGLGIQKKDIDLLPAKYKLVVYSSEQLRKLSRIFPLLIKVADSVYLESVNNKN